MSKGVLAFSGLILLVVGISLGNTLRQGTSEALAKDGTKKKFGMIASDIPQCVWDVAEPDRVMAENKSQAVVINTKNPESKPCESFISLRAPDFDMRPPKEEIKVSLPAKRNGSISWIIKPRRTGTYEMAVSDVLNTKILGITVTNVYGLTAGQAKALSTVGSLFGPMLTVPWWWDWYRRRKQKQPEQKNRESNT